MKQNNTLVQNIISGLHGDLGEFLMVSSGRLILTQKDSMLKQHFEQLNFILSASLNLYELTELLNLIRFSVQLQSFTNIIDIPYFDVNYQNAYIKQNTQLAEFIVKKYSKFPNIPNTKGIQMLIFVLESYIRHYHETVNVIIEDIINNYKQLYSGLESLDYKLIDDNTDPFIGFLTQQLQIADVKHFQFVSFVKDFYEIYIIKLINQPLTIQKEEYQVSETVLNKQKQSIYDAIKNMSAFSFILNQSQNFKQQLLPNMQLYFHEHIHGLLITKYYKNMVFPFLLQSFINDFQKEFFIQSKVSILNSQSQLQNNPFEGFNQIQNYNETVIIKNLFPYFVDEQLARDMVVCSRMVLYLKENNIPIDIDLYEVFLSEEYNMEQFNQKTEIFKYVTSEFEFHSCFKRYNDAIQGIYIDSLQKTDLKLEILSLLKMASLQTFSKQMDEVFTQYYTKLKSIQRFDTDTIEVENDDFKKPTGLGEIIRNNQLKLNNLGIKKRIVPRNETNVLIYDINDTFSQVNLPVILHYQRGVEKTHIKYTNFQIIDLETEFFQTDVMREVFSIQWSYSGRQGGQQSGFDVLINNLLFYTPVNNQLIIQPPIQASFSKVFRQLLILRFIQFNFCCETESFRSTILKLKRFHLVGRRRQYHFQTGAIAIVMAGNRMCAQKATLVQLVAQINVTIQGELVLTSKNFHQNMNVQSYQIIKTQLAGLVSDLFLSTKLTKMRFYIFIMQIQQTLQQFCVLTENFNKIVNESVNEHTGYGIMETSQIKQLMSAINVMDKQINELIMTSHKLL